MHEVQRRPTAAILFGAPIGALGGLIGLGGAEFRLPVLKAVFRYTTHRAVALNLAVTLVTMIASLGIRVWVTPIGSLSGLAPVIIAMIGGSMSGAWVGAAHANRLSAQRLERLILLLLVGIGGLLVVEAFVPWRSGGLPASDLLRVPVGVALGVGIGVVSSTLGVAGGELIIPTLVFVFGADIQLAGTASVLISFPAVCVGVGRYARRAAFTLREDVPSLILPMGIGSVLGALAGGLLIPYVAPGALKLVLGIILIVSAVRIFRHRPASSAPHDEATTVDVRAAQEP